MKKQYLTCICFEEFLNKKLFESNFQFSAAQNFFPVLFPFFFSILAYRCSFSYLSSPSHTLIHFFRRPIDQFDLIVLLFAVSSASGTVELPRLLPLSPFEIGRTPSPSLSHFHLP
jgi:hypothetical protein